MTRTGSGIGPLHADAGLRQRLALGRRRGSRERGLAEDDARAADRLRRGPHRCCGSALSFARVSVVEAAEAVGGDGAASCGRARGTRRRSRSRRAPICVTRVTRSATMVRGHGHWPSALEARLVDVDDDHRALARHPRRDELIEVEGAQPQRLDRQRVPDAQQQEVDEEHKRDGSCHAKPIEEAEDASHGGRYTLLSLASPGWPLTFGSAPRKRCWLPS